MKTDLFQSCGCCWVFQVYGHTECSILTATPPCPSQEFFECSSQWPGVISSPVCVGRSLTYNCLSCVSARSCSMIFLKRSFLGLRHFLHKDTPIITLLSTWGRPFRIPAFSLSHHGTFLHVSFFFIINFYLSIAVLGCVNYDVVLIAQWIGHTYTCIPSF